MQWGGTVSTMRRPAKHPRMDEPVAAPVVEPVAVEPVAAAPVIEPIAAPVAAAPAVAAAAAPVVAAERAADPIGAAVAEAMEGMLEQREGGLVVSGEMTPKRNAAEEAALQYLLNSSDSGLSSESSIISCSDVSIIIFKNYMYIVFEKLLQHELYFFVYLFISDFRGF
jgi:hypothetical protein